MKFKTKYTISIKTGLKAGFTETKSKKTLLHNCGNHACY